ncbi:MAG TPA: MoaD/ThiS family protein [Spirochaetota bacterium]|nr:MoaD/ThiS family protein [Spirochaetota bacterium]
MKAKIKLFATLRTGRFEVSDLDLNDGTTISELLKLLEIGQKEAAIIFINGIHGDYDSVIKTGDEVAIFPPIGGG